MLKQYADKLSAALRSDKYKQGRHCLKKGDEFCCLGVLCEIVREEVQLNWQKDQIYGDMIGGNSVSLPKKVMELVGMKSDNGTLDIDGKLTCLASLNDTQMKTFAEIADVVDARWEEL